MALDTTLTRISAEEVRRLREMLADDDADETLRLDMIEGETDALELLDDLLADMREQAAFAEAIDQLSAQYKVRFERLQSRVARHKEAIESVAEAIGVSPIKRPGGTISRRKSPPRAIVTDEAAIPDGFLVTTTRVDKRAIAQALKEGRNIPGAALSNQPEIWSVRS